MVSMEFNKMEGDEILKEIEDKQRHNSILSANRGMITPSMSKTAEGNTVVSSMLWLLYFMISSIFLSLKSTQLLDCVFSGGFVKF